MRSRDDHKRAAITATAANLFATQDFHKVRLEDVAAAAGVGKGTLYIYFKSKEDLYRSILYDGLGDASRRLEQCVADRTESAKVQLGKLIRELVKYAFEHAEIFDLLRKVGPPPAHSQWAGRRRQFLDVFRKVLRRGIARGEFCDPHPELTALFIPSLVRTTMMFGPANVRPGVLSGQIERILWRGIVKKDCP